MMTKSAIKTATLFVAVASLVACQEEPTALGELEQPANLGPVGFSNFVDLSDSQIAATINPAFGFGPILNEAKSLCTDKPVCELIIFEDGTTLPTALPYTDREMATAIAFYKLDRANGTDELKAHCQKIARTPDENCIGG